MLINNNDAEKMYKFLYEDKEFPYKHNYFKFLLLRFNDNLEDDNVFMLLDELIANNIILKIDNNYIIFYFYDLDFEARDIFISISDDFSVNLFIYSSGRISIENKDNFKILYKYINNYLGSLGFNFCTNTDLTLEVIKSSMDKLRILKPVILNNIYEDSQFERLILAMFENNLNVTKTASTVYMHRNTIINKLDTIKQETGLNLQNFKDALCMYWLIKSK